MMQKQFLMKTLIILLTLSLLNSGCARDFTDYRPYQPPVETGDGLATGTLAEVKIDTQMILKALSSIEQGKYGEVQVAGGMKATPRELLKIGAMMLHHGSWKGKQIISEHWVEKCRDPYSGSGGINIPGEDMKDFGYSYAWWTKKIQYRGKEIHWYSGNGWGGQKLIVLPEINTVVVFTGARYTKKVREYEIFERFILPAISPVKP